MIGDELREKMVRNRERLVAHSEDSGSHVEQDGRPLDKITWVAIMKTESRDARDKLSVPVRRLLQ